ISGLTAGRVPYVCALSVVCDSAVFTFTGTQSIVDVPSGVGSFSLNVAGSRKAALETGFGGFTAGLGLAAASAVSWDNGANYGAGTMDLCFSRNTAGVAQIGTTACNALGSLLLASVTPSVSVAIGGCTIGSDVFCATGSGALSGNLRAGGAAGGNQSVLIG